MQLTAIRYTPGFPFVREMAEQSSDRNVSGALMMIWNVSLSSNWGKMGYPVSRTPPATEVYSWWAVDATCLTKEVVMR